MFCTPCRSRSAHRVLHRFAERIDLSLLPARSSASPTAPSFARPGARALTCPLFARHPPQPAHPVAPLRDGCAARYSPSATRLPVWTRGNTALCLTARGRSCRSIWDRAVRDRHNHDCKKQRVDFGSNGLGPKCDPVFEHRSRFRQKEVAGSLEGQKVESRIKEQAS